MIFTLACMVHGPQWVFGACFLLLHDRRVPYGGDALGIE